MLSPARPDELYLWGNRTSPSVVGQGVHAVAFSPDGAMLAVTCQESPIRVLAVEKLRRAAPAGRAAQKGACSTLA